MATRMQQRRGTAAQWTSADPILAAGEIGFETDTGKFKIGDGTSVWSSLSYFTDSQDFDTTNFVLNSVLGVGNGVATLNANGHVPISQLGSLIAGAPESLDTLNELADALNSIDAAIQAHSDEATNVHGIADTALLATKEYTNTAVSNATNALTQDIETAVGAHNSETLNVHGIADTGLLATTAYVDQAVADENSTMTTAVSDHAAVTQNVHGIADTTLLATKEYVDTAIDGENSAMTTAVSDHAAVTENVHGIADTSLLATKAYADASASSEADSAQTAAEGYADSAVSTHNLDTTNVHGIADTSDLVLTNDARLSDERTPLDYSVTDAKINSGGLSQSSIVNLATDLAAKAPLESPALTGTPTAPTASAGDNSTKIATTAYVETAVSNLVASAPGTLDTLNELAAALGDDANFSTTVTNSLALKLEQSDLDDALLYSYNSQTSSYTLALSDATNMVELNSSSSTTVTVPTNASVAFPIGTAIDLFRLGTGSVTVVAASGVTIYATPGLKLRAQYSGASLIKRDTNTWILTGDLSA